KPTWGLLTSLKCQGSNDGSTWTTLYENTNTGDTGSSLLQFSLGGGATPTPTSSSVVTPTPTITPVATPTNTPTPPVGNTRIGTNFWFTYGDGCIPFRADATFAVGSNPWKQEFLDELAPYMLLRCMEWQSTNNNDTANWADRKQQTDPNQHAPWLDGDYYWVEGSLWLPKDDPPTHIGDGIACEWLIDLANRLDKDLWVCIPHKATDDYSLQMALLFKNTLEPGRKLYIEYSNEAWNTIFDVEHYCEEHGLALGLDTNQWAAAHKYYAVRALQHLTIWENVFTGADRDRLVLVLAGQDGNDYLARVHLNIMNDPVWNPSGVVPDAYAVSPYIGHGMDGADPNILTLLNNEIPNTVANNQNVKEELAPYGMRFITYEGGQHVTTNADVLYRNPGIYNFYINYLNQMNGLFDLMALYCHVKGPVDSSNAFGHKEFIGESSATAHKYRAIMDWINAHP
ncbi:MAG: hypothetical protein ACM3WV_04125, partial [Bacillota bacterium]